MLNNMCPKGQLAMHIPTACKHSLERARAMLFYCGVGVTAADAVIQMGLLQRAVTFWVLQEKWFYGETQLVPPPLLSLSISLTGVIKRPLKLRMRIYVFSVFYVFFIFQQCMTFYVLWVVAHVFSNTVRHRPRLEYSLLRKIFLATTRPLIKIV